MDKVTHLDEFKFNKENMGLNNFNEQVNMLIEEDLEYITKEIFEAVDREKVIRNFASKILAICFINFQVSREDLINTIAQDGIEEIVQHIVNLISNHETIKKIISE
jgi:hypothetical protein